MSDVRDDWLQQPDDWPQHRRDDFLAGYEFARSGLEEDRKKYCCHLHPEMRRFVTPWEVVPRDE